MEWRDEGVLLTATRHGEGGAILDVLTQSHGRRLGLMHGGASRRRAGFLQPGSQISVAWRGRLETQLGVFRAEPIKGRAAALFDDPAALAALSACCALLASFLPEREPQPRLYAPTCALLDALVDPGAWPGRYAAWELLLLEEIGYGLDLSHCAATGGTQELVYVSPKSGRAVSRAAGAPYADKLLPLPQGLRLGDPLGPSDFVQSLRLTGRFLEAWAAPAFGVERMPAARARLAALAERAAD